jgi:photosystem II stability/assembly factor-like uncharacterized protein
MRRWKLLLSIAVFAWAVYGTAALLSASPNGKTVAYEESEEDEPKAEEHEKKEQREIDKRLHSDSKGKLRDDLFRKASKRWETLQIDASRELPAGGSSSGQAPGSAPGGGVVGVQWSQIGPAPLIIDDEFNYQGVGPDAGQVVSIAIDPRNTTDRVIYSAFNDGGVWKTTDGGDTWQPKTDKMPTLSIGAVALDPVNPSIVYAGTGNIFNNGFFKAVGVYRSIDAGETWSLTADSAKLNGRGINMIEMPAANTLLVATNQGLWRSTNSGDTFTQVPVGGSTGGYITDLDLDTQSPSTTVYASRNGQGIFVSTDGGATFPAASNLFNNPGAPASVNGFVSFAQSTTASGQTMYANDEGPAPTVAVPSPSKFGGMWKSTDGGANWTDISARANAGGQLNACQCNYDQTMGVDPVDANKVFIGFQELYYSSDGGATNFANISDGDIHWDHHEITFSPPSHRTSGDTTTRMWVGTDGGNHYTDDAGGSWVQRNGKIATNLFRAMDIGRGSAANNGYSYGGAQDTGTMRHKPGDSGTEWHESVNADGGPMATDWQDPENAFGISNGQFIRTNNGGDSWMRPGSTDIDCLKMTGAAAVDPNDGDNVYVPLRAQTSTETACADDMGTGVYRSTDGGANFAAADFVATSARVTAIATTPTDSNLAWFAQNNGRVSVSTNFRAATPTVTQKTVNGAPAGANPIAIAIDPVDTNVVVVVYPGFSSTAAGALSKHVFRTADGGTTWSDIGGTDLVADQMVPDTPLYSVVIDPQVSPHAIIVSTDFGVMRTSDGGASWQILGVGLPNVNATSLQIDSTVTPSLLRVGTYGRSAFELTTASGPLLAVNCDLAYGFVDVGTTATKQCTMFNVGDDPLHVNSFTRVAGSPSFSIISGPPTPVTIAAGSHIDYTIQFAPTSSGDKTATFQINSDDPSQPTLQIPATGTGVSGQIALSGSLAFGVVPRGQPKDRDVIVQNVGKGTLKLTSVAISGDSLFSIVSGPSTPVSIPAGEHVTYTVRFAPPANAGPGPHTATFSIASNDPSSPTTMVATAEIGVPKFTLSTTQLEFGGVPVDNRTTPSTKTLETTVSNQTSCPLCDLDVTGLTISGANASDFTLVAPPSLPYEIGAGNTLDLKVRFNPSAGGVRVATLTITTDDPVNPSRTVQLDGRGLKPAIDANPTTLIFAPTVFDPNCGSLCGLTLPERFTNSGEAELIIDEVSFTGPFSGPGATSPKTRVQVGSIFTEQVTFKPVGSAATKVTGNLHIEDSMPEDPGNIVAKDVPLCGESVGRGVRVLVVNKAGTPVAKVDALKLTATGVSAPPNVNLKNLPLVTVDPPTSCQKIQRHYENQNLSTTSQTAPRGSYYTLTTTVGTKKATSTFGLAVNEFKLLVVTVG